MTFGPADVGSPSSVKKKKKRRRRKKKKERQRSYVKGNVIDARHELYALSIAMMIGVRSSLSPALPSDGEEEREFVEEVGGRRVRASRRGSFHVNLSRRALL